MHVEVGGHRRAPFLPPAALHYCHRQHAAHGSSRQVTGPCTCAVCVCVSCLKGQLFGPCGYCWADNRAWIQNASNASPAVLSNLNLQTARGERERGAGERQQEQEQAEKGRPAALGAALDSLQQRTDPASGAARRPTLCRLRQTHTCSGGGQPCAAVRAHWP